MQIEQGSIRFNVGAGMPISFQRGNLTDTITTFDDHIDVVYGAYDDLSTQLWASVNQSAQVLNDSIAAEIIRAAPIEAATSGLKPSP